MSQFALRSGRLAATIIVLGWAIAAPVAAEDAGPGEAAGDPEPTPEELAEAKADDAFWAYLDNLVTTIEMKKGEEQVEAVRTVSSIIWDLEQRVVPDLEKMLKSKDEDARIAAAEALWRIRRDPEPVLPVLLDSLNRTEKVGLWGPRTISILDDLGPHAAPAVPRLIELYRRSNGDGKQSIAYVLGQIGPKAKAAIPVLVESLGDHTEDRMQGSIYGHGFARPTTGSSASYALRGIGKEALPAVAPLLKHDDHKLRINALRVLAVGGEAARPYLPTLIEAADDRNAEVRRAAVGVMGELRIAPDKTVPVLAVSVLEADVGVRMRAAESIGAYGPEGRAAVRALTLALKDEDGDVRARAARALGAIGPDAKAALPELRNLLEDTGEYHVPGSIFGYPISETAEWAIQRIERAEPPRD